MIAISSQKQSDRSRKRSGAGRKTSERDFRKKRGAGAECGAGDRGTATERRAEVQKVGGAWSGILARSRSAHMLCLSMVPCH
jgi:hypothetical protein